MPASCFVTRLHRHRNYTDDAKKEWAAGLDWSAETGWLPVAGQRTPSAALLYFKHATCGGG